MKRLLKGLFSALSLIGALVLITELVLVAVFYFSGALTTQKMNDVVKVVQGELASPPTEEEMEKAEPTPLEIKSEDELKEAVVAWLAQKEKQEQSLSEEREAVESMLRELSLVRVALDKRATELARNEQAFAEAVAARAAAEKDEGFKAAVAVYEKMDAKDVGDLLYGLTDEEVLRYLRVFKPSFSAEILARLKRIDDEKNPEQPGEVRLNRAARLQEMLHGEEIALAGKTPTAVSP